jgi:hypothetical protein
MDALEPHGSWCPEPESNRHAPFQEATDFKSGVSTSFTTGAEVLLCLDKALIELQSMCKFSMAKANKPTTLR